MNLHVAIVHFPIVLFTLYGFFELFWFKNLRQNVTWFWVKFGLVFLGTISAWVTLQTGEMVEQLLGTSPLIETHSLFANITTCFFTVVAILYIVEAIERGVLPVQINSFIQKYFFTRAIWKFLKVLKKIFLDSFLIYIIALVGLALITITGALGGAIAFGPDVDPVASFVYKLFF